METTSWSVLLNVTENFKNWCDAVHFSPISIMDSQGVSGVRVWILGAKAVACLDLWDLPH